MLACFPVVAVIGARQVGKSTLVQSPRVGAGRAYFTLDDLDVLCLAARDPKALLTQAKPVTIDEAQRRPDLLRVIKCEVDRNRAPGSFLLTGSSDLNFSAALARELAGRAGVLPLMPISWREVNAQPNPPAWLKWLEAETVADVEATVRDVRPAVAAGDALFAGGYPPAVTAPTSAARRDWFAAYRHTYLERDVRQVANIGNLPEYARLFQTVAARAGQLLNLAALARDVGLPASTAARYLSILEASFQVVRLAPWFANLGKRLVKTPKVYWSDTGLLAHLLGVETWDDAVAQGLSGALFESFVLLELSKHIAVFDPAARLHFVRSHSGLEVNALLVRGLRQLPVEIKSGMTIRVDDAEALETYLRLVKAAKVGVVIYGGSECRRLSRRVLAVPVTALLV